MRAIKQWIIDVVVRYLLDVDNQDIVDQLTMRFTQSLISQVCIMGSNDSVILVVPESVDEDQVAKLEAQLRAILKHERYLVIATDNPISLARFT